MRMKQEASLLRKEELSDHTVTMKGHGLLKTVGPPEARPKPRANSANQKL